jgi:DNA repair protein RecO (recombination protein O)
MLNKTKGIVLRSVKYGETSVVTTIFTELYGTQAYMVQGVRSSKSKNNKAALLQPATLLDLVVYHHSHQGLQRLREFQHAYLYTSIQAEVVKNSIALFSVELLLRLLPEAAPSQPLFEFSYQYFNDLDTMPLDEVANFPLFFIIHCSRALGYAIEGTYSETTPYLNLADGKFTANPPATHTTNDEEAKALGLLLQVNNSTGLKNITLNATMRYHLLEWYIEYLHRHTQHLKTIKSLAVLQTILH